MKNIFYILKSFVYAMLLVGVFAFTMVEAHATINDEGAYGTIVGDVLATFADTITISIYPPQTPSGNFEWNDNFGIDSTIGGLPIATPFEEGSGNGIINQFESVPSFNLNISNPSSIGFMQQNEAGELISLEGKYDWIGLAFYTLISTSDTHRFTSTPAMPQPPNLILLQASGGSILTEGNPFGVMGSRSFIGLEILVVIYPGRDSPGTVITHLIFDEDSPPTASSNVPSVPADPAIESTQPEVYPVTYTPVGLRLTIGNTTYTQNGAAHQMEAAPFIAEGRTMVPLALIAEALGVSTRWDGDTRSVIISGPTFKNVPLTIDVPLPNNMGTPVIVNGRTFVPIAYISEMLGADVRWDGDARAVYIQQ
ncbi:MAG: copper amine oxidase N-terminal domain-containing protein [Defluviitaleaceae bacterium]|nr:copper amine oxidase N-terminal domain-containing protein [Defluviitaleaceae bacterium]